MDPLVLQASPGTCAQELKSFQKLLLDKIGLGENC